MDNHQQGKQENKDVQEEMTIIRDSDISYCGEFSHSISKIVENYRNMERSIVTQLLLETPDHAPTTGSYRETVWKSLFEIIVPRKFCIEQGVFVIDSFGRISKEVDLAIFDEMYTPYIFNYGKIKYIPIEAVAVVIQCKSKSLSTKNLNEWVSSIASLKTSLNSVLRVMQAIVDNNKVSKNDYNKKTQTATRPIRILCTTKMGNIRKNISKKFDITLNIKGDHLNKIMPEEKADYDDWYNQLNHYNLESYGLAAETYKKIKNSGKKLDRNITQLEVKSHNEQNVIMSLTFQLNQLLMLINNPMQFPHQAYVDMFNRETETSEGVAADNGK